MLASRMTTAAPKSPPPRSRATSSSNAARRARSGRAAFAPPFLFATRVWPRGARGSDTAPMGHIAMVGFDADDTLWRSQDYFDDAQLEFEAIVARYIDLEDKRVRQRLYEVEGGNIGVFGYGVKGMALSMGEAAVELTDSEIRAGDIGRIIDRAKRLLRHPVELLPGVREAVEEIGSRYPLVLITKGDLFHQEAKVRQCGMARLFRRIEIVSEKEPDTYARLFEEFGLPASRFAMVGNSVRSDILPVLG